MKKMYRSAAIAAALGMLLCGCSKSGASGSSADVSAASGPDESAVVITEADLGKLGSRLRPIAELFSKRHYTMECTLTGTDISEPIRIKRIVNGADEYQLQTEKLGSHGCVTLDGVHYDFDYVCGMYRETNSRPELSMIEQIAANGLSVTKSRRSASEDGYDIEEYVYTGETYITTMDFYFEKSDGRLVKYDTVYSVEGKDDIIETRTVERLDGNIDESVFNAYFSDELADYENMSEDQRIGFCKGLIGSWGITAEEMSDMGVSSTGLKNIDYNTLFRLIYTYGEPHQPSDNTSSEKAEDASSADESGKSEGESSADESEGSDSSKDSE